MSSTGVCNVYHSNRAYPQTDQIHKGPLMLTKYHFGVEDVHQDCVAKAAWFWSPERWYNYLAIDFAEKIPNAYKPSFTQVVPSLDMAPFLWTVFGERSGGFQS